jgi:hypothetical protein
MEYNYGFKKVYETLRGHKTLEAQFTNTDSEFVQY